MVWSMTAWYSSGSLEPHNRWTEAFSSVNVEAATSRIERDRAYRASMTDLSRESGSDGSRPSLCSKSSRPGVTPRLSLWGQFPSHATTRAEPSEARRPMGREEQQHERGSSAPPATVYQSSAFWPVIPLQQSKSVSKKSPDRLLPPLPADKGQYRLGAEKLPWSVAAPEWYIASAPEDKPLPSAPAEGRREMSRSPKLEFEPRKRYCDEDPKRMENMGSLHQAMMTVDTLRSSDAWEAWTWEGFGDMPRGPRSLGWAVSRDTSPVNPVVGRDDESAVARQLDRERERAWRSIRLPEEEEEEDGAREVFEPPPPYCVGQWEARNGLERSGNPASTRSRRASHGYG